MSANIEIRATTLESLPAEVRNLIYSFAVVEDEPLVVYRATRYRPCTTTGSGGRIVHEYTYLHERPALAAVNRGMRRDVLSIFYSANTFLFNYNKDQSMLVEPWLYYTIRTDGRLWHSLNQISSIILEFYSTVELSRNSFLRGTAELRFELGTSNELKITFGGPLRELCTCGFGKFLPKSMHVASDLKSVLGPAAAFEKHHLTGWRGHILTTRDELCRTCAKRVAIPGEA